jgi:hypothetical protein
MLIDNLDLEQEKFEESGDYIPSGGFVNDTGIYKCVVDLAYMGLSSGGAHNVTVHFRQVDGKATHRETFYITSGKEKGQKPYYLKDGKKNALPGFEAMNSLAQITTGKILNKLVAEKKVVKLWSYEAKAEEPTEVMALTEMMGKPVYVGLVRCKDNKNKKVGDEYIKTNEVREYNEAQKFFFPNKFSVTEAHAKVEKPEFFEKWVGKYPADFVRDRFEAQAGVSEAVNTASAEAAAATAEVAEDLFA